MAVFLLDVNVLLALAWPSHKQNPIAGKWFARHGATGWATCPFTEAAFVRILSNPRFSPHALSVEEALVVLQTNLELPGHHFWAAKISFLEATKSLGRLRGHNQVTDAYLVGLAIHCGGKLATMDTGIEKLGAAGTVELIS